MDRLVYEEEEEQADLLCSIVLGQFQTWPLSPSKPGDRKSVV